MSDPKWLRDSSQMWREIQTDAALHGAYRGVIDGIPGQLTAQAVREMLAELEFEPPAGPSEYSYGGPRIRADVDRDPGKLIPAFARQVELLFQRLRERGFDPLLWEGHRSLKRAADLADRGTGIRLSMHCYGAAVDIVRASPPHWGHDPMWRAIGQEADALGLTWGGHWPRSDRPHVQAIPLHAQERFRAMTDNERYAFVTGMLEGTA